MKKILTLTMMVILTSCTSHRVILGEIEVYGNNEIKIDAPEKK